MLSTPPTTASAVLPLFEGGLRKAELQRSWSQFNQTTDYYKSTVLNAFQQVEDGLSLTTMLATQAKQQETAVQSAVKAENLTFDLYRGGLENYLDVTVSQVYALTAQIEALAQRIEETMAPFAAQAAQRRRQPPAAPSAPDRTQRRPRLARV